MGKKAVKIGVFGVSDTSSLTTGSETVTGTEKNDTIDATTSSLSSARTLDTADVIDGGDGTDTLNVTMKNCYH